jgi:hypothetical protein
MLAQFMAHITMRGITTLSIAIIRRTAPTLKDSDRSRASIGSLNLSRPNFS